MTVANNLLYVKQLIAEYELKYGREKNSVHLLAVSKNHSVKKIAEAIGGGQSSFGENYLQEALDKIDFFKTQSIEWHFIGNIQRNKTRKIAENFAWVESINSESIAKRLNDQRPDHLPPLNVCIEINISHEKTKTGIEINELTSLIQYCQTLPRLKLRGLMAIPVYQDSFSRERSEFHKLQILFDHLRTQNIPLDTLSMGMSHDFEAAIAEGSTQVRIGTAIFGKRSQKKDS